MEPESLSLEDAVRVSEDVVFREIDGEAVLLELGTGIYFGLNEAGTRIWTLLQRDGSLRNTFAAMQEQYEVPAEQLERSVDLKQKNVVRFGDTRKRGKLQ